MVWTLASAATTLRGWDSGLYECKATAGGEGRRLYVIMTPAGPADGGGGGAAAAEPRVDVTVTDGDDGWSGMLVSVPSQTTRARALNLPLLFDVPVSGLLAPARSADPP